ncbi:hypothetical protein [Glaciimonas immobilis]|uniref:LexA regulated protein n=1 Tax=Glaciimonas immobilis TaxID=728004 RepID=A0A840RSV1_9BURK|nr:hypothetical protein [Glaciimonas immobilis]KAF3996788.1 hypothetical protein HAV38_16485 [Glaciimonas immobilis]MBB5199671.1 hypothetical protein [Glaciimonas immobilis]
MKKSGMAKMQAMKLSGKMKQPGTDAAFGQVAPVALDRREQRKLDQSLGLVPFAVKLNSDLVQQIQTLAQEREVGVNELVAELLIKALAA